ncbi:hypothetical protein [Maribacter sp. 2210JD10-5]|uniref:hypothetical protein n=1 Tax=Maribacter sp. 2210JD10-5 TaxID=3386272 RepID=UPI0039BCDC4F
MRTKISILMLFCIVGIYAQDDAVQFQKEIDQTVWKPFQKAFETLNGDALNATYATEVLRVTPNGIDTDGSFKAENLKRFVINKADGITIALDFWFDSRHTNKTTSYEVGFYRIAATDIEENTSYNYGQFHIVLKKINGEWKIIQDWDTNLINGEAIGADDFAKKEPLVF